MRLRSASLAATALMISSSRAGELLLSAGTIDTATLPNLLQAAPQEVSASGRQVLQLRGPITQRQRRQLSELGIVLGDYLPRNAFLVDLKDGDRAALRALDFVEWLGDWRPQWKLAPGIGQRNYFSQDRIDLAGRGEVAVEITLFEGADVDLALAEIEFVADGNAVRVDSLGAHTIVSIALPLTSVGLLADLSEVQFVEEAGDYQFRNSTTRWIAQTNTSGAGQTPLYDAGINGAGQIVGVMDGQVDVNHCSFSDTDPIGANHRKIQAYNTALGSDSHGTHVAGTAIGDAAADNDTRGIAWGGRLVYHTIPAFSESAMNTRLTTHHGQGARVHTNSWGDDGTTAYNGLCRGIDSFSYSNEDSLVLFAVSNGGVVTNPDNAKNLLAVGASSDTPSQGNHCSGGTGPTSDGRRKPEVYLPGCGTLSSRWSTACSTTSSSGTSMASPAVAGAGLLVRQYFADGYYPSRSASIADAFSPSGALVKACLVNSAVNMTGVSGYPSNLEGWGRIKLDNTMVTTGNPRSLVVRDVRNASGLLDDEVYEQQIQSTNSGERMRITLVWTDPPAAAGAGIADINDLDLEVVAPDSSLYLGNVFDGNASITGGTRDDKNNVEQVHIAAPALGDWTVRVRATQTNAGFNGGRQGYALVISGAIVPEVPALTIQTPSGTPAFLAPGAPTPFDVRVTPGEEALVPGSATLWYRDDGGAYQSTALTLVSGNDYTATLPDALCESSPQFYLSAEGDGGTTVTLPANAPIGVFSATVGVINTTFSDDMELNLGWQVNVAGDDTATTGVWTRVNPNGTAAQPEDDNSDPGVTAWVTGQGAVGGGVGDNDVDGGKTTLYSPLLDLSAVGSATISYYRWYSNDAGGSPNADTFTVEISNGGPWTLVETVGPAGPGTGGGWIYYEFDVESLVALSGAVRVRFTASDTGGGSIIEAGVDDFIVTSFECENPTVCLGDLNEDGLIDLTDLSLMLANFGTASGADPQDGDLDGDGDVDITDVSLMLAVFGTTCS